MWSLAIGMAKDTGIVIGILVYPKDPTKELSHYLSNYPSGQEKFERRICDKALPPFHLAAPVELISNRTQRMCRYPRDAISYVIQLQCLAYYRYLYRTSVHLNTPAFQ